MLEVIDLHVAYGAIRAVRGVSFAVRAGEIVAVIGANGAGKSTTLRAISGLVRPAGGEIRLEGRLITGLAPHAIVARGVVHVPEGRGIFTELTVQENLEVATSACRHRRKRTVRAAMERVFELFPRLAERRRQRGGTLSGGEQQMLAVGRGLMMEAKVLLLDEPSMGLAPNLVEELFATIGRVNAEGTPVCLVEQNAYQALALASRAYVLKVGEVALAGPAAELAKDPEIRRSYLGG